MAKLCKSMKPAPVIQVAIPGRAAFRMSFSSPEGKPLDWQRGMKLAALAAAGDELRDSWPYSGLIWCDPPLEDGSRYIVEHNCRTSNQTNLDAYAECEFKARYSLPSEAEISFHHPSFGAMTLEQAQTAPARTKARSISPAKILESVRQEIRNATDAEAALARLAALVGLDMVPA